MVIAIDGPVQLINFVLRVGYNYSINIGHVRLVLAAVPNVMSPRRSAQRQQVRLYPPRGNKVCEHLNQVSDAH